MTLPVAAPDYFCNLDSTLMNNLEGLTPEQKKFIVDLGKRIQSLESKLVVLQAKMVQIDPTLMTELARNFSQLNLN
jgi:hypothetical protein